MPNVTVELPNNVAKLLKSCIIIPTTIMNVTKNTRTTNRWNPNAEKRNARTIIKTDVVEPIQTDRASRLPSLTNRVVEKRFQIFGHRVDNDQEPESQMDHHQHDRRIR